MSLFGKDATSFSHLDLGILCHSSLQILSSSVRLEGKSLALWGPEHSGEGFRPGYPCTWPHSSFPRLQPVVLSLQLKTPHSMMLPPPCFTVGTVLNRWWAVPGFLHTYRLELRPKSPILVSSDQRSYLSPSWSPPCGFHVSCTEERLLSGHYAIKPWLVEGCSDGWLSTTFSHLPNASLELSHSDLWVLLYLSHQGSSPPIAQFWPDGQL